MVNFALVLLLAVLIFKLLLPKRQLPGYLMFRVSMEPPALPPRRFSPLLIAIIAALLIGAGLAIWPYAVPTPPVQIRPAGLSGHAELVVPTTIAQPWR